MIANSLSIPVGTRVRVSDYWANLNLSGATREREFITSEPTNARHVTSGYLCITVPGEMGYYGHERYRLNADEADLVDPADVDRINARAEVKAAKQAAARAMMAYKSEHEWCGSAESVARANGLGSYLPRRKYVDVTYRSSFVEWPDEARSDYDLRREGRAAVRAGVRGEYDVPGASDVYDRDVVVTQESDDEYEPVVPDVDDESVEAFHNRLRDFALAAESEYNVRGVRDFLAHLGIEVGPRIVRRRVGVTMYFDVPVNEDEAADEVGESCVDLMLASAGAEGVTVERVWEDD